MKLIKKKLTCVNKGSPFKKNVTTHLTESYDEVYITYLSSFLLKNFPLFFVAIMFQNMAKKVRTNTTTKKKNELRSK